MRREDDALTFFHFDYLFSSCALGTVMWMEEGRQQGREEDGKSMVERKGRD